MNLVILSGYLAKNPELRKTQTGKSVCKFTLAIRRNQDKTDFIPVTVWEHTAEFVQKYFRKGDRIEVTGRLRQNIWTDDGGTKHYSLEVDGTNVEFGERIGERAGQREQTVAPQVSPPVQSSSSAQLTPPVSPTPPVQYYEQQGFAPISDMEEDFPF